MKRLLFAIPLVIFFSCSKTEEPKLSEATTNLINGEWVEYMFVAGTDSFIRDEPCILDDYTKFDRNRGIVTYTGAIKCFPAQADESVGFRWKLTETDTQIVMENDSVRVIGSINVTPSELSIAIDIPQAPRGTTIYKNRKK